VNTRFRLLAVTLYGDAGLVAVQGHGRLEPKRQWSNLPNATFTHRWPAGVSDLVFGLASLYLLAFCLQLVGKKDSALEQRTFSRGSTAVQVAPFSVSRRSLSLTELTLVRIR